VWVEVRPLALAVRLSAAAVVCSSVAVVVVCSSAVAAVVVCSSLVGACELALEVEAVLTYRLEALL